MPYLQGEVYRYLPTINVGPESEGEFGHRVLIVSSSDYNGGHSVWTVLFTTKKTGKTPRPSWVSFNANNEHGLTENCIAQCETLTKTPHRYLAERMGRIDRNQLEEVIAAIGSVMNASCFAL